MEGLSKFFGGVGKLKVEFHRRELGGVFTAFREAIEGGKWDLDEIYMRVRGNIVRDGFSISRSCDDAYFDVMA